MKVLLVTNMDNYYQISTITQKIWFGIVIKSKTDYFAYYPKLNFWTRNGNRNLNIKAQESKTLIDGLRGYLTFATTYEKN